MSNKKIIKNIIYPFLLAVIFGWVFFIFVQKADSRYSMKLYENGSRPGFAAGFLANIFPKNKSDNNPDLDNHSSQVTADPTSALSSDISSITQTKSILSGFSLDTGSVAHKDDINQIYNIQKYQNDMTINQMKQIMSDNGTFGDYNMAQFEYIYEITKDPKILASIVRLYTVEFDYKKAYEYFTKFGNNYATYLGGKDIMSVLTNSDLITNTGGQTLILQTITALNRKGILLSDDVNFYNGLISFANYDTQKSQYYRNQIKDPKYADFQKKINDEIKNRYLQPDSPNYYLQGLLNLEVLKLGYFQIAQKVAVQILNENINYILPYQILAYSHFVMNDWVVAGDYFTELKKKDPDNESKYNFLLGICYFWQDKYEDSIIFLKQSFLPEYQTDVFRYLSIGYDKIGDDTNFMTTYKNILGQDDINASDFLFFFEKILYRPLTQQKELTLYKDYKTTAIQSVNLCFQQMNDNDLAVCNYGQVGVLLAENKKNQAGQKLIYLATEFNKSYLREALGDRYLDQDEKDKAKEAYVKSLSTNTNDKNREYTKQKLVNTIMY